jgi:lysophospholipase L1-like esterase
MMWWGKLLAASLVGLVLAMPARAEGPACGALPEALDAGPMRGTAAAVARGNLRIMVVGSASTQGGGTSGPQATWPERFARLLAARLGAVNVDVLTLGARGMVAADHARLIAEQAPALRPHLVIWQLGTVEAARGLSADDMADVVKTTAARIRAARGERTDVVLMDPQFSRFLRSNADVELYRDRLRMAGAASGAQLFSRWDIMRNWSETERLDLERAPREMRTRIADELHDCLARALVEFVLDGVREAS